VSTHADYRQRCEKLEADFPLAAGIPAGSSDSCMRARLDQHVDVRVPAVILAIIGGPPWGRWPAASLLLSFAGGSIALARDRRQALDARCHRWDRR
jgi:hypothetical protein